MGSSAPRPLLGPPCRRRSGSRSSGGRPRAGRSAGAASAAPGPRRCWCSAASTATSRRAWRRCRARRRASPAAPPPAAPVWLLPALNPDGLARGSKNSARDVDLNRNFPARSFATAHAPGYFPGPAPLSEPETRVLADLVAREPTSRPSSRSTRRSPASTTTARPPPGPRRWRRRAAGRRARDIGYPTPGSLGSWLGIDRGLPVLTLELPPGPAGRVSRPRRPPRSTRQSVSRAARAAMPSMRYTALTGGRGSRFLASFRQLAPAAGTLNPDRDLRSRPDMDKDIERTFLETIVEGAGLPPLRPEGAAGGGRGLRPRARGARAGGRDRGPRDHAQGRQRRRAAAVLRGRRPAAPGAGEDRRRGGRGRAGVPRALRRGLRRASTRS